MADALETARAFLESLHRFELSILLSECSIGIADLRGGYVDDEWFETLPQEIATVAAPKPIDEALRTLSVTDRKRIADAVANGYGRTTSLDDVQVETVRHTAQGAAALLAELLIHRAMMVSVATGGDRIQEVEDFYRAREHRIQHALPADVHYSNSHEDLWDWYRHWSEHLPQYKDRREYIRRLFAPAIDALAHRSSWSGPDREPTGWERVDRTLSKARAQLSLATVEEDFQAIGLLCREATISVAQAVFEPTLHQTLDDVEPSKTDANRMLEAYIGHVFPGSSNKEIRAHARASLALALNLQHRRTATRQLAALCLEATTSTVAVVSIIAREN
jgi:hypothetical protein